MAPDKKKHVELEEKEKSEEKLDNHELKPKERMVLSAGQLELKSDNEFDQKMFRVVLRLLVFVTVAFLTIITRFWGLAEPPHIW